MDSINRWNEKITRYLLVFAAVLAFSLCFLVVADVIGRVVFNRPVQGTTEMVSLTIVMVCWLQAGFAIRSGGMLHVDSISNLMSPRFQSWMAAFGALAGVIFFGVLFIGSFEGAEHAWVSDEFEGEGVLRVPVWPTRFAMVLGSGLATLNYILMLIRHCHSALEGLPPASAGKAH